MADPRSYEDEAVLYVLGELSNPERREFEARLAESAELRKLVCELEEGATAMSLSAPQRCPPAQVWRNIQGAVGQKTKSGGLFPFWLRWMRSGWAVAAVCVAGWLAYALWVNRTGVPTTWTPITALETNSARPSAAGHSDLHASGQALSDSVIQSNTLRLLQVSTQAIGALRWQVNELTQRMANLAHDRAWQQSLLGEPDRIKFFQIAPTTADGSPLPPISTNLQQALFLTMARELGWLPAGATKTAGDNRVGQEQKENSNSGSVTNQTGVDFVDMRSSSNNATTSASSPGNTDLPPLSSTSSNMIPGFVSGTNAFLAVDSSITAVGSAITFWAYNTGQYLTLGNFTIGNNPTVVAVPTWAGSGGSVLTITTTAPGGSSITIGQVSLPATPPPNQQ